MILEEVALRKESVDRNNDVFRNLLNGRLSLSARRAWIEIVEFHLFASSGVSLSARRAWIEIRHCTTYLNCSRVALRKESVDRNCRN